MQQYSAFLSAVCEPECMLMQVALGEHYKTQ